MNGQMTLFEMGVVPKPGWPECFTMCRHFDSHPDYPPDYFPYTRSYRCTYCMHQYGTSGKQFKIVKADNGTILLYCKHFEGG